MKKSLARTLILILGCWYSSNGAVASDMDQIEVLQLQRRSADQVIPLVRPLLRRDEAVSGTGFQLILRARPQTIAEVRKLLRTVDAGVKNLMILVTHEDVRASVRQRAGASVQHRSGVGGAAGVYAGQSERDEIVNIAQRLRVVEGTPAYIHAGQTIYTPNAYGTFRHDVGTGMHVVPRVNGERVNLEIQPYRERLRIGRDDQPPGAEVQRLGTVVSGELGEWIYLGGVEQASQNQSRGILSGSGSQAEKRTGTWVKVLLVD